MIDGWKQVPILLNLQRVLDGVTSTNLTKFIMQNLVEFGSMTKTNVANKLVCFGTNGVIVFQGLKNGVTTKMMQNHVPFMSGVHMAHCTNLVVQTLSNLSLVGKIEKNCLHLCIIILPTILIAILRQVSWLNSLNAKAIRLSKT